MIPRIAGLAAIAVLAAAVLAGCGGAADRAAQDQRSAVSARLDTGDLPGRWVAIRNGGTLSCPALAGAPGAERAASYLLISRGGSADNVIFLFPNALAAKFRMQGILSAESRRCIGREMWDKAPVPVRSAPLTIRRVGDETKAARFTWPPRIDDLGGDVLDVVVVRIGRGGVVVEVNADAAELDAGLRDGIVAAAVRKLRAALAG
jgi:hypothetical protein